MKERDYWWCNCRMTSLSMVDQQVLWWSRACISVLIRLVSQLPQLAIIKVPYQIFSTRWFSSLGQLRTFGIHRPSQIVQRERRVLDWHGITHRRWISDISPLLATASMKCVKEFLHLSVPHWNELCSFHFSRGRMADYWSIQLRFPTYRSIIGIWLQKIK